MEILCLFPKLLEYSKPPCPVKGKRLSDQQKDSTTSIPPPRKLCRARRPAQNQFLFFGITFSSGTRQPNRSGRLAIALELETRKDRENRAKIRTTYQVLKVYKGEMRFAHFTLFVVDDACVVLRELSAEFFRPEFRRLFRRSSVSRICDCKGGSGAWFRLLLP